MKKKTTNNSWQLSSGWKWGIVGFILSTIISWMAPFGRVPREFIERAYERFEVRWAERGWVRSLKVTTLTFDPLLDYPHDLLDFKGNVGLENLLSSDLQIKKIDLLINGQPASVRLWEPTPGQLEPKQRASFVFYTTPILRTGDRRYRLKMELTDSTDRVTSAEANIN